MQYYYLCEFVKEFDVNTDCKLVLNDSLYDTKFRNCLAHYGLGQFLKENDLLKGLTIKEFRKNNLNNIVLSFKLVEGEDMFFNKYKKNNNEKKLESVLQIAESLIEKSNKDNNMIPIKKYIKAIGNTTLQNLMMELFTGEEVTSAEQLQYDFGIRIKNEPTNNFNFSEKFKDNKSFKVDLKEDFILPVAWNRTRFVSNMCNIGKDCNNNFKYDESNHYSYYIKPLNITLVYNGNHSILTGMLKSEGKLIPTQIIDLSDRYKQIKFDGSYYRDINNNKILQKVKFFEIGCLFEIGRLLIDYNVSI